MSEKAGITHDTAARLLGIAPADLEKLVQAGAIHRNDKNSYVASVLVNDYVTHLRARHHDAEVRPKQADVAAHVDLSERSVREWEGRLALKAGYTLADFRLAYIRHLRETAAGRLAEGGLDLATERAKLAREQRLRIALENAVTTKELAPVAMMTEVLAKAGARIGGIFDGIVPKLRRRNTNLSAAELDIVATEIAKARNYVAGLSLADLDDPIDDPDTAATPE